jgi:putative addiction module antidote
MKQKIIKIGNSVGIIIPYEIREEVGLKLGDSVSVEHTLGEQSLTVSKKGKTQNFSSITPNFMRIVEKVNKQYGPALRELAGK